MSTYPGTPGYRPTAPPRVKTVPGGRVPPRTHAPKGGGGGGGAGASGYGLPTMQSPGQITAAANKQAWASIEKMMGSLPSTEVLDVPFSQQRAAIQPLVDAHHDFLLKVGQQQAAVTNGLSNMLFGAGTQADAGLAGSAGVAGAPIGATAGLQGNVTPQAASQIPAALGASARDFLVSLIPSATAQGIGNVGRVNAAENDALTKLADARTQISGQYGDLADKSFTSLQGAAFDKYKSELAAIAAQAGVGAKTAATTEKTRHDKVLEGISQTNADTASKRVSQATSSAATKTAQKQDDADRRLTETALKNARTQYSNLGGVKGSAGSTPGSKDFQQSIILQAPKPDFGSAPKGQVFTFHGATPAEAMRRALHYKAQHPPDLTDPANPGHWDTPAYKVTTTGSSSGSGSGTKDRPSESTRRLRAWRTFKADLTSLHSPLSDKQMQQLFRTQFGDPTR